MDELGFLAGQRDMGAVAGLINTVEGAAARGSVLVGRGRTVVRKGGAQYIAQGRDHAVGHGDIDVVALAGSLAAQQRRSEEHTSELQSLMRHSYAVFCLEKKKKERINYTK